MKRSLFLKFLPGIAWFFVILFLTCLPGDDIPEIGWLSDIHFDKIVHIGMFALLVFLFHLPVFSSKKPNATRIRYGITITVLCAMWGLAIEFIQKYWVPGRSFDLVDWAADSAGGLIALWFCIWLITHKTRHFWLRNKL